MLLQDTDRITSLLSQWKKGDDDALKLVIPELYEELRRLAGTYVRRDGNATLQATALVHEFYLHVSGLREVEWECRGQFIAAAARTMRNILVDSASRRNAAKRGGGCVDQLDGLNPVNGLSLAAPESAVDIVALDAALEKLAQQYPRHARVVELMFFGGLTVTETAQVLSATADPVSLRTVERDWRFARTWLQSEMKNS